MKKTKFVVLANCQSGPLSLIIERLIPNLERVPIKAIHTLNKSDPEALLITLREVELVIHQPIGDTFGPLSISELKVKLPNSTFISFPSIYFDGYFPDLMYLRLQKGGTLKGVIGDFHDRRIIESFLNKKNVQDTFLMLNQKKPIELVNKNIISSLAKLEKREVNLDIKLTKYLEMNVMKRRLFYVFNHPTNDVLIEVTKQLAEVLGEKINREGLSISNALPDYLKGSQVALNSEIIDLIENKSPNDHLYAERTKGLDDLIYSQQQYISAQFMSYEKKPELDGIFKFAVERQKKIGY